MTKIRSFRTRFGYLFFILSLFGAYAIADKPRILLTNDDGIESKELAQLAEALRKEFDLVISAPRENQSGSSQATSGSSSPLRVEKIYKDEIFFGYGVHGRPADAVKFGLMVLGKEKTFDLVVSGINRGSNVGDVSHLSGTVGAAMHAQYFGYPSIATSQDSRANTELTVQITLDVIKRFLAEGAPVGTVISINVPAGEPKGLRVKPAGGSFIGSHPFEIVSGSGDDISYKSDLFLSPAEDGDNDTRAYQQGYVTITPLKFNWTDEDRIETLSNWQLELPK